MPPFSPHYESTLSTSLVGKEHEQPEGEVDWYNAYDLEQWTVL